jgi:transcriptional regulator with XRE-family HTH domain
MRTTNYLLTGRSKKTHKTAKTTNWDMELKSPNTEGAKQVVIEWINNILGRKGWHATELARRADLAPSTLLRLLNNPHHRFLPSLRTLQKIAEAAGIPISPKVMEALGSQTEGNPVEVTENIPQRTIRKPPRGWDIELRHVSALPASLQAAAAGRRETFVTAPPQLEGDETAFGFRMPDDSLGQWLPAGALMFATKWRDPIAGDLVMVTGKDDRTRVRLMVGIDEAGLKLAKIPPSMEEVIAFDDIAEIAIVSIIIRST